MKKMRFVWILFSLVIFLTSLAAAPLAGSAISLVDVRNDAGGGVIFIFNVSGEFSKSELKGFVEVQGADANYDLHCTQKDATTVHCTTSRKTGGQNVVVTFGGATFWAYVPEAGPQYCYNVWDWPLFAFGNEGEVLGAGSSYEIQTTHCQNSPAHYGDVVNIYNPVYDYYYDYEFLPGCVGIIDSAYWYSCNFAN